MSKPENKISREQAVRELWLRHNISWKLKPHQKDLYDLFYKTTHKTQTWLLARRSGKTYTLAMLAIEACLREQNTIVKFLSPTKIQISSNLRPIIRDILKDCPEEIRPEFKQKDYIYYFPNGSEIQLAGSESGHYEKLRGGYSHIAIIDEAQDVTDLNDVVKSVLLPTTLTTKGKVLLAGTPPKNPDHDFNNFVEDAELRGSLIRKTVYDNTMLTPESIEEIKNEVGGENSEEFRREFLCELIKDPTYSVIPEFTPELEKEIVKEWPKPPFYESYEAMDLGFKDLTVVLFAYYDFRADKVIIEDEIAVNGTNLQLPTLIQDIKAKEAALWTNPFTNEICTPSVRVSDINYIVTQEIARASQGTLNFTPAKKDDKEAAINKLRVLLQAKKIIIHPRCVTLIRHLKNVRWDKNRNKASFSRSPDDGHYDACFTPGNKVLTIEGYKKIEDIKIGDRVLTHLGNFKEVTNTMSREYKGEVLNVKVSGRDIITCTPEHLFFSSSFYKNRENGYTGQLFPKTPDWKEACSLDINTRTVIPAIPASREKSISNEMCFLYGYYVAEGSIGGNGHQISFAGHKKEIKVLDIINKAIKETYGNGKVGTSNRSKRRHILGTHKPRTREARIHNRSGNARIITVSQAELREELKLLGKNKDKKFPIWSNQLDSEQSLYMFLGYMYGDGHFSKDGAKSGSISPQITESVDILSRKAGFTGNFIKFNRANRYKGLSKTGLIINDLFSWYLDKQQTLLLYNKIQQDKQLQYIFSEKLMHPIENTQQYNYSSTFKKIQKIESEYYEGPVYNIEVKDDNSYTINGSAVHNCDAAIYLIRHINFGKNPYPFGYDSGLRREDMFVMDPQNFGKSTTNNVDVYKKIFGIKGRK